MEKQEFLDKIKEVGACEDSSQRLVMLTELQDEVSKVYDNEQVSQTTINTLNETISKNNEQIENLQKVNMQLFLRVGEQKDPQNVQTVSTGVQTDTETNKRKFEDLFKE